MPEYNVPPFIIYSAIFVAGILDRSFVVPRKLSSEIYSCLEGNNKKCRNVVTIL